MPSYFKVHFSERLERRIPVEIRETLLQRVKNILPRSPFSQPQRVTMVIGRTSITVVVGKDCALTRYVEGAGAQMLHPNRKGRGGSWGRGGVGRSRAGSRKKKKKKRSP